MRDSKGIVFGKGPKPTSPPQRSHGRCEGDSPPDYWWAERAHPFVAASGTVRLCYPNSHHEVAVFGGFWTPEQGDDFIAQLHAGALVRVRALDAEGEQK